MDKRTTKLWLFGVPFVVAVLWIGVIAFQAFASKGSMQAAPGAIEPQGWFQIVLAAFAALEAGKGWLAVLRTAAESASVNLTGPKGEAVSVAVDVASLGYYKWQLGKVADPAQKALMLQAARLECDAIRDREFPVPTN